MNRNFRERLRMHFPLLMLACIELLRVDLQLVFRGFPSVHSRVRNFRCKERLWNARTTEEICRSVDVASVLYFKEVRCLQRSAVATCLLREHGIHAEMVIGVQQWPFRGHAWVEVEHRIVNDKSYVTEIYGVMERC